MEPMGFQIVYDEVILSAAAQLMHFERLCGIPQYANDYLGFYDFHEVILDKRPFFFPFLLSLVHELTGYRIANVFFLNTGLTLFLILLVFMIGKLFSDETGGILSVLLAGTFPLLAVFATGGHFEILNLVMLNTVILLGFSYLRDPKDIKLISLVYGLVLLAQVRYESGIYFLPFGVLVLIGWLIKKRVILPWLVVASPMFMIMNALQFRMVKNSPLQVFQEGPNGRLDTFSLSYFPENFSAALDFFFGINGAQPNSFLLSVFGIASLVGIGIIAIRGGFFKRENLSADITAFVLMTSVALFFLILMLFNYGLLNRHITSRLSLPVHLLFILLPSYVYKRLGRDFLVVLLISGLSILVFQFAQFDRAALLTKGLMVSPLILASIAILWWGWKAAKEPVIALIILPLLFIVTITGFIGHAHRYSQNYTSNDILLAELDFLKGREPSERVLFVAENPYSAMLTKTNTTLVWNLSENPDVAREHLRRQMYSSIFISRTYQRGEGGKWSLLKPKSIIDETRFVLDPVKDYFIGPNQLVRIEKLKEVKLKIDGSPD
jgi:hypothetical protein